MKTIKSYDIFVNESVKDFLKPKSKEDMRKAIDNMLPGEKLRKGMEFGILSKEEARDMIDRLDPEFKLIYGKKYDLLSPQEIHELFIKLSLMEKIQFMYKTNYRYSSEKLMEEFQTLRKENKENIISMGFDYKLLTGTYAWKFMGTDKIMLESFETILKRLRKVSSSNVKRSKKYNYRWPIFNTNESVRDMMKPVSDEVIKPNVLKILNNSKSGYEKSNSNDTWNLGSRIIVNFQRQYGNHFVQYILDDDYEVKPIFKEIIDEWLDINYPNWDKNKISTFWEGFRYRGMTESVRDMMKPVSDETIEKALSGLTQAQLNLRLEDAVKKQQINIIRVLLKLGADPNFKNSTGNTIVFISTIGGITWRSNIEITKMLLDAGADPTIPNVRGVMTLKYAEHWNRTEIAELLKQYIKTNESVRDHMKPKSEEDVLSDFLKLSKKKKLSSIWKLLFDMFGFKGDKFEKFLKEKFRKLNIKPMPYHVISLHDELEKLTEEELIKLAKELSSNKTNESVRDHMKPKSEEDVNQALDRLTEGDYETFLKSSMTTLLSILGKDYPDEVYNLILQKIDFDLLRMRLGSIVNSVANTRFSSSIIREYKSKVKMVETHQDITNIAYNIGDEIGDISYRDNILIRLIMLNPLEKTKEIIRKLIVGDVNESVRDHMKPKSEEDIKVAIDKLSPEYAIRKIHSLNILDSYDPSEIKKILNRLDDKTKIELVVKYKLLDYYTRPELRDMLDKIGNDFSIVLQNDKFINLLSTEKFEELKKHIVDGLISFYSNYHKYVSFSKDRTTGKYDLSTVSTASGQIRDRLTRHRNGIYVVLDKYDFGELKLYITKKNVAYAEISSTDYKIWSHDKIRIVLDKLVADVLNGKREKFTVLKIDNLMR